MRRRLVVAMAQCRGYGICCLIAPSLLRWIAGVIWLYIRGQLKEKTASLHQSALLQPVHAVRYSLRSTRE